MYKVDTKVYPTRARAVIKEYNLTKAQQLAGCVNHTCGKLSGSGYGLITSWNGYAIPAHKLAYCQSIGIDVTALPRGKITHTCKNIRCINPDHMVFTAYASAGLSPDQKRIDALDNIHKQRLIKG